MQPVSTLFYTQGLFLLFVVVNKTCFCYGLTQLKNKKIFKWVSRSETRTGMFHLSNSQSGLHFDI